MAGKKKIFELDYTNKPKRSDLLPITQGTGENDSKSTSIGDVLDLIGNIGGGNGSTSSSFSSLNYPFTEQMNYIREQQKLIANPTTYADLPRSFTYSDSETEYTNGEVDNCYLQDAAYALIASIKANDFDLADKLAKGIMDTQYPDGSFTNVVKHNNSGYANNTKTVRAITMSWIVYALSWYLEQSQNTALNVTVSTALASAMTYISTNLLSNSGATSGLLKTGADLTTYESVPNFIAYFAHFRASIALKTSVHKVTANALKTAINSKLFVSGTKTYKFGINADGSTIAKNSLETNSIGGLYAIAVQEKEAAVASSELIETVFKGTDTTLGVDTYKPYSSSSGFTDQNMAWFEGAFQVIYLNSLIGKLVDSSDALKDVQVYYQITDGTYRQGAKKSDTLLVTRNKSLASTCWFVMSIAYDKDVLVLSKEDMKIQYLLEQIEGAGDEVFEDDFRNYLNRYYLKWAPNELIPAGGKTAKELMLIGAAEPINPDVNISTNSGQRQYKETNFNIRVSYGYLIKSLGGAATIANFKIEKRRGGGAYSTLYNGATDPNPTNKYYDDNGINSSGIDNSNISYKVTITDSLGGINSAEVLVGASQTFASYSSPSKTLSVSGATTRERGDANVSMTGSITRNSVNVPLVSYKIQRQAYVNGAAQGWVDLVVETAINGNPSNYSVPQANITGLDHTISRIEMKILVKDAESASFTESSVYSINLYYPWFYGSVVSGGTVDNSAILSSTKKVEALPSSPVVPTNGFGTGNRKLFFAVPKGSKTFTTWFRTGLDNGTIGQSGSDLFAAKVNYTLTNASPSWSSDYDVYITPGNPSADAQTTFN